MGAHHRLRSSATDSDSDSGSSAASRSTGGSDDDEHRHKGRQGGTSSDSDSDDEPEPPRHRPRRRRPSSNLVLIAIVVLLLLCAVAAAAYYYLREGKTSSTSASDAASTGDAAGGAAGGDVKRIGVVQSVGTKKRRRRRCKKGVGYNDAKYTTQLDVCWVYDWSSAGGAGIKDGAMYVPMLWGPKQVDGWEDNAKKALAAGATHVLGFNEPDLPEQANLSPSAAAQLWKDHVEPLAGTAKLVSPAVTNGVKLDNGTSMGVLWLVDFLAACDRCTVDAVALHWYDSARNTAYFTSYLEDSHKTLNKPIWLTEFMGTGTPAEQKTFLEFAVPYLEKQDWVERYAAFGDFLDNPVAEFIAADDGSLNDLGKAYSEAK
ncbi:hypothetical protein JCM3775_000466 [Rhodotorula graminis]